MAKSKGAGEVGAAVEGSGDDGALGLDPVAASGSGAGTPIGSLIEWAKGLEDADPNIRILSLHTTDTGRLPESVPLKFAHPVVIQAATDGAENSAREFIPYPG